MLFLTVQDCPTRQVALHLGSALRAGREVEVATSGPVSAELRLLCRAMSSIYSQRVTVSSTSIPGWSSAARRDQIVILTDLDAYFSERPSARISGCESAIDDRAEFYAPVPGSIVA